MNEKAKLIKDRLKIKSNVIPLTELFDDQKIDAFQSMFLIGGKYYHLEDLTVRDYSLESTTPFMFELNGNVIEENSWVDLLRDVSVLLLNHFPKRNQELYDMRCNWSKQEMFFPEERTNSKKLSDGLFININHTALHSCWFLQDILDFFQVDKSSVLFLIHRPSGAEIKEARDYLSSVNKNGFAKTLAKLTGKEEMLFETKVVPLIEKYLNAALQKVSKSYVDFFLFDDYSSFSNYKKKTWVIIDSSKKFDAKKRSILLKCFEYLDLFYKI